MTWLFVPVLGLGVGHYAVAVRHYGLLTPDGLFVLSQLLMTYGTLRLIDERVAAEVFYARLMVGAVALYLVSSSITYLWRDNKRRAFAGGRTGKPAYDVRPVAPSGGILFASVFSVAVTVFYFVSVGYSAFLLGIKGQLSGQPLDVSVLRINSYSGDKYLFPGYVNQFKNIILPSLSVILVTWFYPRTRGVVRMGLIVAAAIPVVLALLGTGQRGAFFLFLLTVVVYASLSGRGKLSGKALMLPVCGVPLGLLATYALGRSSGLSGGPLQLAANELYQRFIHDNQLSGLAAFDYTSTLPTQDGREWLAGMAGILPGNRGSTLSNEVFATLYGSTGGTSPPSVWGSIHYNFGTFAVMVAAVLFGFALQTITFRSMRRRSYNSLQLIGYAGVTVVLGTWAAGSPDALLNTGLAAYLALWYWGGRINRATPREHGAQVPARVAPCAAATE